MFLNEFQAIRQKNYTHENKYVYGICMTPSKINLSKRQCFPQPILLVCREARYLVLQNTLISTGEKAAVLKKESFNLKQQLQHLLISEEKGQGTVALFQMVMKVFHNYELQVLD